MQKFEYIFNVGGDFTAKMKGMAKAVTDFSSGSSKASTICDNVANRMRDLAFTVSGVAKHLRGSYSCNSLGRHLYLLSSFYQCFVKRV